MNQFFKRVGVCVLLQWVVVLGVVAATPAYVLETPLPKWGASTKAGTPGGTVKWTILPAGLSIKVGGNSYIEKALDVKPNAGPLSPKQIEHELARAFTTYQTAANINFKEVTYVPRQSAMQSGFISIGAHSFGAANRNELAYTYYYITSKGAVSADIQFNSDWIWERGNALSSRAVDLYSVALHEIGHALGLAHETVNKAVMNPIISTTSVYKGLFVDDLAGIRYLYGMRGTASSTVVPTPVVYQQVGSGGGIRLPEPGTYLVLGAFLVVAMLRARQNNPFNKIRIASQDDE